MRKRIAMYFTGGTISMRIDPAIGAAVPALSGREIMENVPGVSDIADFEVIDFDRLPGPHMTPRRMLELSTRVRETLLRGDVDGVVVTHGTDTLEETAYLLDLTVSSPKPVVFTGAMRNSSEVGWDGPGNLLAALRVASSGSSRSLGVLVVMNETVLAAGEAAKSHTEAFDSFQSPDFGPLGVIDKGKVLIRRLPLRRAHINTTDISEPVYLLKMSSGSDSTLIHAALDSGAKGLVIEGLGRGNVPPACLPGVMQAISSHIPVIIVSRCPRGRVFESYGYPGGGKQLRNAGVIFAAFLNGQKARIKLSLALSLTSNPSELKEIFEADEY